jgi:hypothetical protein
VEPSSRLQCRHRRWPHRPPRRRRPVRPPPLDRRSRLSRGRWSALLRPGVLVFRPPVLLRVELAHRTRRQPRRPKHHRRTRRVRQPRARRPTRLVRRHLTHQVRPAPAPTPVIRRTRRRPDFRRPAVANPVATGSRLVPARRHQASASTLWEARLRSTKWAVGTAKAEPLHTVHLLQVSVRLVAGAHRPRNNLGHPRDTARRVITAGRRLSKGRPRTTRHRKVTARLPADTPADNREGTEHLAPVATVHRRAAMVHRRATMVHRRAAMVHRRAGTARRVGRHRTARRKPATIRAATRSKAAWSRQAAAHSRPYHSRRPTRACETH